MNYHFEDIFTNRYWDISGIRMKLIETIRAVSGFLDTNFWLVWCTLDYVTVVFQSSSGVLCSVPYLVSVPLLGQIRYGRVRPTGLCRNTRSTVLKCRYDTNTTCVMPPGMDMSGENTTRAESGDLNKPGNIGQTPLLFAAWGRQEGVVKILTPEGKMSTPTRQVI